MIGMSKISTRLYALVSFLSLLLLVIGFLGLNSASRSNQGLNTVYQDRVIPLKDLKIIADMYAVNIVDTSHKVRNGNISWEEGAQNVVNAKAMIAEKWKKYLQTALVPEEKSLADEANALMNTADTTIDELLDILQVKNAEALEQFTVSRLYAVIDPVSDRFSRLVDVQLKVAEEEYSKNAALYERNKVISLASIFMGIIISLGFSLLIIRSIVQPLSKAGAMVGKMANGDFSFRIDAVSSDEIGLMILSLNTMSQQLAKMIQEVVAGINELNASSTDMAAVAIQLESAARDTADKSSTVSAASEEMSVNIQSVSAAMEQSSGNVNIIASAIEEMTSTVHEIAQNAEKAREISEAAVARSQSTSLQMSSLGESAHNIGRVTETISEISEQTNLLALNATIEAARAGEAGKGFAVVANEIKELARQTAEATVDIKNQISGIQTTTASTVSGIENISSVIVEINNVIHGIASAVEEQSVASGEIANNLSQASQGIGEVNENVAQSTLVIADITREIAGINQQSVHVGEGSNHVQVNARKLSDLAAELDRLVGQFKF